MILVADVSALIALSVCDSLALLDALFGQVIVPEAVYREVALAGRPESARDTLHNSGESVVVRIGMGCKALFCSQ